MALTNCKYIIIGAVLLLFTTISIVFGQAQTQTISTTLQPGPNANGPEVRITLTYKFINVFGEVVIPMSASTQATSQAYWYKGKRYTSDQIGTEVFSKMRFLCPDISADIFKGSARVTSFNKNCVIEGMASALDETYNPGWKTSDIGGEPALAQYSLRNLKAKEKNMADNWYAFESVINKYEREQTEKANLEKYNQLIKRADQAFQQQQWEQAIELYKEAQPLNRSSDYPKQQLSKIAEQQKAQERDAQYQAKIAAGNDALAQNDLGTAKKSFQDASRLSDAPSEAQAGLKRVEAAEAAQKAEASKKEEASSTESTASESTENRDKESTTAASGASERSAETRREDPQIAAQRAEAERKRQEFERQQRVKEYEERKDKERSQNMATAGTAGASAMMLHYFVAEKIFENVGIYHPENTFYGNSIKIRGQLGYQISSAPIFKNVTQEVYDGNTYSYIDNTQNYQTGTLDLVAQGEFWPLYGDHFGFGINGGGYAGHGILFQNFSWGMNYGFRSYLGSKGLQLQLDYQGGIRNFSHFNWIEPTQIANGKSRYNFVRYGIGPRFVWNNGDRKNDQSISIQALFENPDFRLLAMGNSPLLWRWLRGIRAEFDMLHGVNGFVEIITAYQRSGEVEYSFDSDATFGGTYFRVGMVRNFDLFGGSVYDLKYSAATAALASQHRTTVVLPSVGFSWLQSDSLGTAFNNFLKPTLTLIGFEKEYNVLPWFSLGAGINAALLQGAEYKLQGNGNVRYRYQDYGLDIPLNARVYKQHGALANTWLLAGLKANVPFYREWQSKQLPDGILFNDLDLDNITFNIARISNVFGAGIDFPTGDATVLRIGVLYEKTRSVLQPQILPYHLQGVQFVIGLIY
ncbi:MAG: hypothetical protein ACK417_02165 [Bacteroidia bacterium]